MNAPKQSVNHSYLNSPELGSGDNVLWAGTYTFKVRASAINKYPGLKSRGLI